MVDKLFLDYGFGLVNEICLKTNCEEVDEIMGFGFGRKENKGANQNV